MEELLELFFESLGTLTAVTNEDALCAFTNNAEVNGNACDFDFDNASAMIGSGKVHTLDSTKQTRFYIKCKDSYDNLPGDCNIVLKGGVELPESIPTT